MKATYMDYLTGKKIKGNENSISMPEYYLFAIIFLLAIMKWANDKIK